MSRGQIHSAGIVKRLRHAFIVLCASENTGGVYLKPLFSAENKAFLTHTPCFYINDGNERVILCLQQPDLQFTHCFEIGIQWK
jgi:hypothetical protein